MIFQFSFWQPRMFLTSWNLSPSLLAVQGEKCFKSFRPTFNSEWRARDAGCSRPAIEMTPLCQLLFIVPLVWLTWNVHSLRHSLPKTFHGLREKLMFLCEACKTLSTWHLPTSVSSLPFCLWQHQTPYGFPYRIILVFHPVSTFPNTLPLLSSVVNLT